MDKVINECVLGDLRVEYDAISHEPEISKAKMEYINEDFTYIGTSKETYRNGVQLSSKQYAHFFIKNERSGVFALMVDRLQKIVKDGATKEHLYNMIIWYGYQYCYHTANQWGRIPDDHQYRVNADLYLMLQRNGILYNKE